MDGIVRQAYGIPIEGQPFSTFEMVRQVEVYPNLMSGRIALNVRIEFVLLFIDTIHQG